MPKLFVVAGHGGGDPGAVGNGYQEQERVRALAARLKVLGGANVTVGDTSIDWYRANKFASALIPKDAMVVELHMDSAAASAKGGHVIVKQGFSADAFDNALASFIGAYFPGRSNKIVGRSDLQNVNVCASRGINYRLLEVCFISNASDIAKFNGDIDAVATGILNAAGISVVAPTPVYDGRKVQLWTANNTAAQLWKKEDAGDGWFYLKNAACDKYLDVKDAGTKAGTAIQVYPGNKTDAQKWEHESNQLVAKCAPKMVLDAVDGGKVAGTAAQLWSPNNTGAQDFIEIDHGDGYVAYINPQSMLALDVVNGGK